MSFVQGGMLLIEHTPTGAWTVADLSGQPHQTRAWPDWTTDRLSLDTRESWLSAGRLTDEGRHRLLHPRVLLASLYHPEFFPLPRFPPAISDLARAARSILLGRVELMDMQLGVTLEDILERVATGDVDILGVSANFGQHDLMIRLLDEVTAMDRPPMLLAGGSLTVRNERLLLERYPHLVIGRSAGEPTIADILAHWHGDLDLEQVRGVGYVGAARGEGATLDRPQLPARLHPQVPGEDPRRPRLPRHPRPAQRAEEHRLPRLRRHDPRPGRHRPGHRGPPPAGRRVHRDRRDHDPRAARRARPDRHHRAGRAAHRPPRPAAPRVRPLDREPELAAHQRRRPLRHLKGNHAHAATPGPARPEPRCLRPRRGLLDPRRPRRQQRRADRLGRRRPRHAYTALVRAHELGITLFDTADVYGLGRSERLLGRLLRHVDRDGLVVSSKVGYFAGTGRHPYHPRQMSHQLATTLDNLGTDHLDVYFLHSTDFGEHDQYLTGVVDLLGEWRDQGLIRAVGMRAPHTFAEQWADHDEPESTETGRFLRLFHTVRPDVFTARYNLLSPLYSPDQTDIFAFARRHRVGVLIKQALGQGLLIGTHNARDPRRFSDTDHRRGDPRFAPDGLRRLADRLAPLRARYGTSTAALARVALRYALQHAPDSIVLVGFRDPEQIHTDVTCLGDPLTDDEIAQIRATLHPDTPEGDP